ncbi:endolytic transglycosylase MltG [Streptomyces sp. NPDC058864]
MTDYGRSPGSEAWHPEDPLFGDQWGQQQGAQQQQHQQHQQYSQYQQNPQYQQHAQQPQNQQQQPQNPQYQQQGGWDPYGNTGQQQQYPYDPQQQYDSWGAPAGYGHDGYGGQQQPDYYGQGGYPPPQRPDQRYPEQQPQYQQQQQHPQQLQQQPQPQQPQPQQQRPQRSRPAEQDAPLWDDEEAGAADDHSFFSGADDDEDDEPQQGRNDRRGRAGKGGGAGKAGKGGKKRRSGMACLVVLVVLGGGIAGVGWFGYQYYQSNFGPPPDFAGEGSGEVQVEVPQGASGIQIGNILKKAGVVKSVDAFTAAVSKDPKGNSIQAGVYVLHKEMAASSAVTMMLDPKSQNVLVIAEGLRDVQIYAIVDAKLGLDKGTTAKVAEDQVGKLGLPDWANDSDDIKDPLEGFLWPSRYSVGKDTKPVDLLRSMVTNAKKQYTKFDVEGKADKLGLESPLQVVTLASLVQAEGKSDEDFRKMARVVYNRLKPNTETNGKLEFDSTYNYLKNQSEINLSLKELRTYDDAYNTYYYRGLPPGPIGNPGAKALAAAMDPEKGNWYYFISLDGHTTKFTETLAEHDKLAREFDKKHNG